MGITWNIVHNTRWRTAPPVESNISEEGEYYIDTSNLFLCASASIVKENDENRNEDSEVAPVSNFLHRLWLQIDLSLNNTLVSYSNNSYRTELTSKLCLVTARLQKNSQLSANLWLEDTTDHFDTLDADNAGYRKCKNLTANSSEVEMMGKLHLDMCFQQHHLISSVDVKLRLIRAKDTFCLVGDGQYKVKLKDVAVFCPKLRPSDAVRLAHIKALQKSAAKYPLRRVEVKSFTLPRGNLSWTKESMFLGQLPKRLIVGFVDNDAYNGSFQKNPFNFNHYNINFFSLVKDGEQIFSKALQPDFDNKNSCEATSLFSLKLTSTTRTKETASLDPTRWRTHSVCV